MRLKRKSFKIIFFIALYLLIFNSCTKSEENITEIEKKGNIINEKDKNEINQEGISQEIEPIKENTTATILAVGDVMFHNTQVFAAYDKENDSYDFNNTFQYVEKYISDSDIAIANFETVTALNRKYQNYPTFNSPVETIEALKVAGFDIINTANNHSLDKGKKGIIDTIDNINNNGLINMGTYKNKENDILVKKVNDIDVAFLSYTYGLNGLDSLLSEEERSYMINLIDEERIEQDIKHAENISDAVLVYIHWGNEYRRVESKFQTDLSSKMITWGADIIFGSHPHVIQRSEIIKHDGEDKFIIYSLGNFVSDQRRETLKKIKNGKYTEDGVIVKIKLEKNYQEENVTIEKIEYIPTWVNKYKVNGRNKYEILPVNDFINSEKIDKNTKNKLKQSYKNTMDLMYNKYEDKN